MKSICSNDFAYSPYNIFIEHITAMLILKSFSGISHVTVLVMSLSTWPYYCQGFYYTFTYDKVIYLCFLSLIFSQGYFFNIWQTRRPTQSVFCLVFGIFWYTKLGIRYLGKFTQKEWHFSVALLIFNADFVSGTCYVFVGWLYKV